MSIRPLDFPVKLMQCSMLRKKKVEIGQVGRKWAFCFIGKEAARKEEQKQRGDAAHPEIHPNNLPFVCAFPATSFPFP